MTPRSAGWRIVYFIQQLISWIAPPLHSLHWKIFALLFVGLFLPAIYFLWQVRVNIERSHLVSTEQGMIDTALLAADVLRDGIPGFPSSLPSTREIKRRVFKDLSPDLRIVVYDGSGLAILDTENLLPPGTPGQGDDVRKALKGKYGARWERDVYRNFITLHSSIPMFREKEIAGVVSVIKSTSDVRRSIWRSLKSLALPALLAFAIAAGTSYLLSNYLTRVITGMAGRARRIADGESGVRLETWTKSELGDLARALEAMRARLEGKAYIEEMASTLSHELKTPLSSIRGATDVLENTGDPAVREKFLANIRAEVDRLTAIVNNLLALSRIETRPASDGAHCRIDEVAAEIAETYRPRAEMLGLKFDVRISPADKAVPIETGALRQVLAVLLDNAFSFTPGGRTVSLETNTTTMWASDEGCGIEPGLRGRIFERFFTTVNPLTGRRGTGLGLAIAKSLVERAGGNIQLESESGHGTKVTVTFSESRHAGPFAPGRDFT